MILITGATGLVGSHLLVQLSNKGKTIRAMKRANSDFDLVKRVFSMYAQYPDTQFERIEWVNGDLLDTSSLQDLLEGVDEIYHCAAIISFHPSLKRQMMHTNINGTANLVNMALIKGNASFCHVSSIAAIGRSDNGAVITENSLWKHSKDLSAYSVSKYGAEREVWRGIAEGLDAVIVNPSVILGPGNWKAGSSELFSLSWKGLQFFTNGVTGYVDVRDVATAMILLMDGKHFGKRFILSAENISYKDLFTWIAEDLGKKPPHIEVKAWMGEIAWRLFAIKGLFENKKPAITRETARTSNTKKKYSSERLQKTVNHEFIPIRQSIREISKVFLKDHSEK